MPKKQPKNAFYFFMIDFKEEQRKKGIHYANMAEVADAAGPLWRDAAPAVRTKFEGIARKEKQKFNVPERKYTSHGVPIAHIERIEEETQRAIENEIVDIMNMVTMKGLGYSAKNLNIFLMDVNCYCTASVDYVVGESALLHFNLQDGIKEFYHTMINPGRIPIGYTSDVKYGSVELGLDMPDESVERTNYIGLLANTIDYLKKNIDKKAKIPPVFTMPDKVQQVTNFIHQMCRRAGEDDSIFRVYQLDRLFFTLTNYVRASESEGFPKETLALAQLKKDPFKYTPGLACQHHEDNDKATECCLSRVKRWAYTILDTACPVAGIPAEPGKHLPADFDIGEIEIFQEQKKTRLPPSIARGPESCNTSLLSETFNTPLNQSSESSTSKKEKRVHVPLRKPKIGLPEHFRAPPALSPTEFPSLPGRGRGKLGEAFKLLDLDE